MRKFLRLSAMLGAITLFSACSNDSNPTTPPTPTITVASSSSQATAARGTAATFPITITRGGGFTGTVNLAASGLPTGVQAVFSPATLANGVTSSTLTLAVDSTASGATTAITITASGTGVTSQTASISLTVQTPTISIASTTSTATAARGSSASYPLTITRGAGYAGTVNLSATGLPAGVTATFTPASLASGITTSTLTLTVDSTAAGATSTITVTAAGTGVTSQTTTVMLTVPAPAITLAVGSSTGTIVQGATTNIPVTVTRTNGFTGAITVTAEGLPSGVTASPLSIAAGATTGTLVLTATAAAAPTTTPASVVVRASGTGVTSQTATVALTVNASTVAGFTLTPSRAAIAAIAGQGDTTTITLARTGGFTGDVALTVDSIPSGITATLAPTSLTGSATTSKLTVTSTAAVAPGTYSLRVNGTATGQTDRTSIIMFTVSAAPGIALSLAPSSLSIAQSANATSTVTLARVGGFTGDVTLTTTGLPTGATIAFAPTSLTGTATSTVATITVGAATAAGAYNVVITGTGSGGVTRAITLPLTVTVAPGISLSATSISVQQGATGTSTVTLARSGGFTGAANLTVTGLPAGVTASFSPASVTGTTSTLTLNVAASVAAGSYTGTITAAGTGVANATGTFGLTVTTAGTGGGGNIVYRFCAASSIPTFFAYRNGASGAWTAVTAGANNTFSFNLTAGTGQVAYGVPNGNGGVDMSVFYYTAAEFPIFAAQQCNPVTKSVTGTVAGLGTGQSATISLGGAVTSVNANGSFTIQSVPDQATDLIATRTSINTTTFQISIDKVIIRRNINPASGGSIGATLDFGAAETVAPVSAAYTITNVDGEQIFGVNSFQTANGGSGSFSSFAASQTSPLTLFGVPASLTQAGDFHASTALATTTSGSLTTSRGVFQYNRDISARTLALGGAASAPSFSTVATSPYARVRAQGPWQSEYGDAMGVSYTQGNARSWTISASRGYFGSSAAQYDVVIPDLSGVGTFNNAWGLVAGTATDYSLTVYAGFRGLTAITEGASFRIASRSGTITP